MDLDKCIRLVDVTFDVDDSMVIVEEKSAIFLGKRISNPSLPEGNIEIKCHDLSTTFDLNPTQVTKGTILAKIVQIKTKHVITTLYGKRPVKRLTLKDAAGNKNFLNIWGKKYPNLQEGKVYFFCDLSVDKYPQTKPHFLTAISTSSITEAPKNKEQELVEISLEDGKEVGWILGFNQFYMYESCETCHTIVRSENEYLCRKCEKKASDPVKDFKFQLVLRQGEESLINLIGFKKVLRIEDQNREQDSIEETLNELHVEKEVTVSYITQRDTGHDDDVPDKIILSMNY